MSTEIKALTILETYKKLILNQTNLDLEEFNAAVKQLQDLEHYAHYTCGLWATDRPDLFANQIKADLMWQLDFWKVCEGKAPEPKYIVPYVDETVDPSESFVVFCEDASPWSESEHNMVRTYSDVESHKLLNILEKHFGIPNNHKG